jgi:hypothetical protein
MPEPQRQPPRQPPQRTPYELSFRQRRRCVLRAIRHPSLSPAAKQVLVALSVRDDDPYVLPERPPVGLLARHLALAERTVRQALVELVAQACLTFRTDGQCYWPGEAEAADAEARPDLARERAFFRAASALPSRAEHLDMLARLRDRALAAKRIATALSAERALGRALGIGAKQRRGTDAPLSAPAAGEDDAEAELAPPHEELAAVDAVMADRALAPATRHAAIELLLDPVDDAQARPDDDHLRWSERLAGRLGLTVRGARKALAELEDFRVIAQAKGEVCIYPGAITERLRRGTDAPPLAPTEGLDPVAAHVRRLEALRELAEAAGLAPTALTAQHAVGRALDFAEAMQPKAPPKPAALPAAQRRFAEATVLPFMRNLMAIDPNAGQMMLEVLDETAARKRHDHRRWPRCESPPSRCTQISSPALARGRLGGGFVFLLAAAQRRGKSKKPPPSLPQQVGGGVNV